MSPSQKTARASAVCKVGQAIGLPLSAIPAHPAFLRKKLGAVTPARVGLKAGSWANARSILAKTLRDLGVDVMPDRYLAPIAEAWQPLWRPLPGRPYRIALSRFVRFCSTRGIAPVDVLEDHFVFFETALQEESFVKTLEIVARDMRRFWNEAAKIVPRWPGLRIAVPDRRDRCQIPLSAFPSSFAADLHAYEIALTGDALDLANGIKPIRPVSASSKTKALHRLASAAVSGGVAPDEIPDIGALVRPEVVQRALRFIRDRNGGGRPKSLDLLLAHTISTARHWAKAPEDEIDTLRMIKRRLDVNTYEMGAETSRVLRDLDQPGMQRSLIQLPERIFDETLGRPELKRSDLIRAQIALAIAILVVAPLRPRNLAALHLERHLVEVGGGRHRRRRLGIPGEEVKNGEDLEHPLPDRVLALLDRYLAEVRPRLSAQGNLFLFPGEGDGSKGAPLLSARIADVTEARLGVRMTAHKFRAAAGKIILDANPTGQEIARQVLGHRDIHTTQTYYAPLQRDKAVALYDKVVTTMASDGGGRR